MCDRAALSLSGRGEITGSFAALKVDFSEADRSELFTDICWSEAEEQLGATSF